MQPIESQPIVTKGQWRLLTQRDFETTLGRLTTSESKGTFHDSSKELRQTSATSLPFSNETLRQLRRHIQSIKYEHGQEGKIPRANTYRPYRLSIEGQLAAIVVLRASEAFNLCEVDTFITVEIGGLAPLETTRAALLFAFTEAAKNSASLTVQFTKTCAPHGLSDDIRRLAEAEGLPIIEADQGTLTPNHVRTL